MNHHDFQAFKSALVGCIGVYGNTPAPETVAVWFKAMEGYSLDQFSGALSTHVTDPKEGRFCPTPAHILAHLKVHDGRPTPDEAWAVSISALDEAETVVWTSEAANAFAAAKPLLSIRDKVAARRAFIDAYERMVSDARARKQPVQWQLSEGFDPQKRAIAVTMAVELGRIANDKAIGYETMMIEHSNDGKLLAQMPEEFKKSWFELVERLKRSPAYVESDDAIAKRDTEEKKRESASLVDQYAKETQ